jgi:hypothetical protein
MLGKCSMLPLCSYKHNKTSMVEAKHVDAEFPRAQKPGKRTRQPTQPDGDLRVVSRRSIDVILTMPVLRLLRNLLV